MTTTEERISRVEATQDERGKRLESIERRLDRYFLTLLTIEIGGFVALATLIIQLT